MSVEPLKGEQALQTGPHDFQLPQSYKMNSVNKKTLLRSSATFTIFAPGRIEGSWVCRGTSGNGAALFSTCPIPKVNTAFSFGSWIFESLQSPHEEQLSMLPDQVSLLFPQSNEALSSCSDTRRTCVCGELPEKRGELCMHHFFFRGHGLPSSALCLANWLPCTFK